MERGAWWATIHGVAESDTAEQPTLLLLLLSHCPTLCDPIDGSPPGSAVLGILQARTLEWVAFPSPMHESEK